MHNQVIKLPLNFHSFISQRGNHGPIRGRVRAGEAQPTGLPSRARDNKGFTSSLKHSRLGSSRTNDQNERVKMPRQRGKLPELNANQLIYLAGVFESNVGGLKAVSTIGAAAISKTEPWPRYMAETYGGKSEEFVTNGGKRYFGWFVSLERRLELVKLLEESGAAAATGPYDFDKVRGGLEKAVNRDALSET